MLHIPRQSLRQLQAVLVMSVMSASITNYDKSRVCFLLLDELRGQAEMADSGLVLHMKEHLR